MNDMIGKILGVIIAFIMCVIGPIMITVMSDDMTDKRMIYNEMTSFVDGIADTRTMSAAEFSSFVTSVSNHGPICNVNIYRHIKSVNPVPGGDYETIYLQTPIQGVTSAIKFNSGDLIQIEVESVGYSGAERIGRFFCGAFLKPIRLSVVARVR